MPSRLSVLIALCWVAMAWAWPSSGHAFGAVAGRPIDVCVARAEPGMTGRSVIRGQLAGFDCKAPQTDFGPGDFWIVSQAVPKGLKGNASLYVRFDSRWQRAVTMYALYPDGALDRRRISDAETTRALQMGSVIQLQLAKHAQPPVRVAWHVEGAINTRGVVVTPTIATATERTRANLTVASLYSGFAGLVLALLVHNAAMWRVLRQRFQLWYLAMLGGLMLFAFGASGAMAWSFPDISNTGRLRFNYVALAFTGFAIIGFSRNFLEPRVFAGWLNRVSNAVVALLLGSGALLLFANGSGVRILDQIYSVAFVLLIGLAVPIAVRAWQERSRFLAPWLLACVAPYLLGGIQVLHDLGLLDLQLWIENSTLLGMAVQALGASLAIAYRVRQLARERDEARAEELAARLLADTDPLTGLLNRRAFMAKALGRPDDQILFVLDLDRFKSVNDTIGHDGGDEVLRRVAHVLRDVCPPDGLVTRFGGEEFALLCHAHNHVSADTLLARVRETSMPFDLKVTASIGGCVGPLADERDWKRLYRAADQALFAAKDAGRDRARAKPRLAAIAA